MVSCYLCSNNSMDWNPWSSLRVFPGEKLGKVEEQKLPSIQLVCVPISSDDRFPRKLCMDASAGVFVGVKTQHDGNQFANNVSFRDKQFPQTWQRFVGSDLALEVEVSELSALVEVDAARELIPPPDFEPWAFCDDLKAARVLFSLDPQFPEKAHSKGKKEGLVVLWLVVRSDGKPDQIKVARPAGDGFDEEAIAAVRRWRFRPSTCDGKPVDSQINVEVNSKLY